MTRASFPWLAFIGIVWLACTPLAAHAQVYRCTSSSGSIAFQDQPCPRAQRQTIVNVPSRAPPGYVPPPVATSATPSAADIRAAPVPAYVESPPSPLPVMYACIGAVNGKRYLTSTPPGPYLAPLGVMGYPPQGLSQAYGGRGGAGASAPELARPRVGGPRIGAAMTEVQDYCEPAAHAEVCGVVQRDLDENHRKLRRAMPSEEPPLERREAELQDQLRNCR